MNDNVTLVTGATGFIGGRLLQRDDRPLVRQVSGLPNEVIGDLRDLNDLRKACEGVDRVFHCAGFAHNIKGRSNNQLHTEINFHATRDLVWSAARAGVGCFVFLSSVKAMPRPGKICVDENWRGAVYDAYGFSKKQAEAEVLSAGKTFGMHVVNLRLAMVYGSGGKGNLSRMAKGVKAGWFPPLPETGNRRSLVHVDDVISAVHHVANTPEANGKTYIIAHPEAPSGREIYDALRRRFKRSEAKWHLPAGLLRAIGRFGDVCPGSLGFGDLVNSDTIASLLDSECYSSARINNELGWRAKIGLEAGLNEMFDDETAV